MPPTRPVRPAPAPCATRLPPCPGGPAPDSSAARPSVFRARPRPLVAGPCGWTGAGLARAARRLSTAAAALALAACAGASAGDAGETQARALGAAMLSRPVVLLGEVHDNAAQHALRARALRAVLDSGARPALLMEQFDRERQGDIDRALARPGVTADAVIAAGAPAGSEAAGGWQWDYYRPYVELALEYRLPLVAANVSRTDSRRVVAGGLAARGFDGRVPADVAEAQARAVAEGHCGLIDLEQARPLAQAQIARDQFMAGRIEAHAVRGAVLLAGNGHVRADIGVPRWLSPATRSRSVAIGVLEGEAPATPAPYDAVFATAAQPRADPCEALRGR